MPRSTPVKLLSLSQAAEEFPVSRRSLQGLIHAGKLPAFRLGRKIILRRRDVERLLTATPVRGAATAEARGDTPEP